MTPAEIAKKLTPTQVRALKANLFLRTDTFEALGRRGLVGFNEDWEIVFTPLGRAVLAELEGKA